MPLAVDQPRPIAPAPSTTAPPIATDEDPEALLCAPIATVATLPFALVLSPFFKPIAIPLVLSKLTPLAALLKPALSPAPSIA